MYSFKWSWLTVVELSIHNYIIMFASGSLPAGLHVWAEPLSVDPGYPGQVWLDPGIGSHLLGRYWAQCWPYPGNQYVSFLHEMLFIEIMETICNLKEKRA